MSRNHWTRRLVGTLTSVSIAMLQVATGATQAHAQIVSDPSAPADTRPTVTEAPNGVAQIDIARPNATGLSQNRYTDFNVAPSGAILNNSGASHVSRLGGRILGNPNLTGGSARIILNEVTSTRRSSLRGALEVSGNSAEVIVANPNGITCNGCGFINTPRATLTTGVPQIGTGGALTGFQVDKGSITIGPDGLNANGVDFFDIIARAVEINGVVTGKNVSAFLGRNDFNYVTRTATARAPDGSKKPAFGLDSTALGGMYADRITIIGTEAGVAVRTPKNLVTRSGGLTLTADGRIVTRNVTTKKRARIRSRSSSVQLTGMVYAGTTAEIAAATSLTMGTSASVAAAGNVALSARDIDINSASVLAGVAEDGTFLPTAGAVTVTALDDLLIDGTSTIRGGEQVALQSGGALRLQGVVDTNASLTVTSDGASGVETNARVRASQDITLSSGGTVRVQDTAVLRGRSVMVSAAADLENEGVVSGREAVALQAAQTVEQGVDGLILSENTASITARAFTNNGRLSATGDVDVTASELSQATTGVIGGRIVALKAATFDNAGTILAEQNLSLDATIEVTNRADATLAARDALTLTTPTLSNDGRIDAETTTIAASGDIANTANGLILSRRQLALSANDITSAGTILSTGAATLTFARDIRIAGTLDVTGRATLDAQNLVSLEGESTFRGGQSIAAASFANSGTALFAEDFDLVIGGDVALSGTLQSLGTIDIETGAAFTQRGSLLAGETLSLTNGGATTIAGRVEAGNDLTLAFAGDVTLGSAAVLASGGTLDLIAEGSNARTLTNDGRIAAIGDILATNAVAGAAATADARNFGGALTIGGAGALLSGGDVLVLMSGNVATDGTLEATDALTIAVGGALNTGASSRVVGGESLTITGFGTDATLALGGTTGASGNVTIAANDNVLTNSGTLAADGSAVLTGARSFTNAGSVQSRTGLTAVFGTIVSSGLLRAGTDLTLTTSGGVANSGTMEAAAAIDARFGGAFTTTIGSRLVAGTRLSAVASGASGRLANNGTMGALGALDIDTGAAALSNGGTLIAGSAATLATTGTFTNSGTLRAQSTLTGTFGDVDNSGIVLADGNATLTVARGLTSDGALESVQQLALTFGTTASTGVSGRIVGQAGLSITGSAAGAALTNGGTLGSGGAVTLASLASLDNAGTLLAGTTADISLSGALTNRGTLRATGALDIAAGSLDNSGALVGLSDAELTLTGALTSSGSITADGTLAITYRGNANIGSAGRIVGATSLAMSNTGGGTFTNAGTVGSSGGVTIDGGAAQLVNSGALVSGTDLTATFGGNVTNSGAIQADDATILAFGGTLTNGGGIVGRDGLTLDYIGSGRSSLTNQTGGTLGSLGDVVVSNENIDITNAGDMTAGGVADISIDGSLLNSGVIRGDARTRLLLDDTLTNSGSIESAAAVALRVKRALDNRTGGVISSGNTLSITENGLAPVAFTNAGTISAVADILVNSDRLVLTNTGLIVTAGDLTFDLASAITNGGRLNAAGALAITSVGALTNRAGAEIVANDTVTLSTASLANAGLIIGTDVTATLPGDWNATSTGQLSANGGTVTVNLGGNFNNASTLEIGGNFAVNAGTIINSSIIVAGGNLSLTARGNVSNSDLILAAGNLTIATDGTITNDHGVLLSSGNLFLEGRTNIRATRLANLAGVIESDNAGLRIRADTIDNLSDPVSVARGVLVSTDVGPEVDMGNSTKRTITTKIYEDRLTANGAPGQILSAGDMALDADTINNRYSQITSGRNLVITANTVDNVALDLNRRTDVETKNVRRERYCDKRIFGICVDRDTRYITTRTNTSNTALYDRKISAITAVAGLSLQATTSFTNRQDVTQGAAGTGFSAQTELARFNLPSGGVSIAGTLGVGQGGTGTAGAALGTNGTSGETLGTTTDGSALTGPGSTTVALGTGGPLPDGFTIADLDTVNLDNPNTLYAVLATVDNAADAQTALTQASTAFGALFTEAAPNSNFVFETRFDFTNLGAFFGSDYFLDRLGINDADALVRRLGDAYFDTRFIKDQILKQTGLRFLDPNYLNDADQMRALIENAALATDALGLSYGVSLTVAQQRALASDIVWYERQLVGGVLTLVPRLYLANGSRERGPGALVQAANLSIDASAIENLGSTLRASDTLRLVSTGDLVNLGGLFAGNNVQLTAGGNVRVETQVAALTSNGGADVSTLLGRTAEISALGELSVTAGGDLDVLAARLTAGDNLLIDIEGSATIAALESITSSDGGLDSIYDQSLVGSSMTAGQNLQILVDGDMVTLASDLSGDAGVNLDVGGNFALLAGEEVSTYDSVRTNDGFFSSSVTTISQASLTHRSASITSGGDLLLTVGGDALLAGSEVDAAESIDILTGGELIASSVVDSTIESRRTQTCTFFCLFGSDRSSTTTQLVNQGTTAEAQADLIARSGGSATLIASSLQAGGDLNLVAGYGEDANPDASINIIAAQDVLNEATRDEEWGLFSSRGGMFMVTYNEENTRNVSTTTNAASQIIAGGNATLDAAADINVTGSQVEALGDTTLLAGRDINIIAARETQSLAETNELSGLGVSLSTGGGGISLFAGYAENEDGLTTTSDRSSATIVSAGSNLVLDAGRDVNQVGSDLVSGNDALIRAGRDVNSLAAVDNATMDQFQRELRVGITASLNSSGLASLDQARSGLESYGSGAGGGVYEAATNLAAASNVVIGVLRPLNGFAEGFGTMGIDGGTGGGIDRALGLSASVSFGVSGSELSSSSIQGTARPSTIIVGGDLTVIADERIHFEGTQAQAIGDFTMTAREVVLESARSTFEQVNDTTSFNASVGLSASVSTQGGSPTFGPTASVGGSMSDLATSGVTNTNAVVAAGGTLSISTLEDLRIEGANISANEVDLDVGRDLILLSRQDTSETDGSSRGFNASLSTSSANGGVNFSDTDGSRAWTIGSSITSEGRLDIDVAGNTAITGAAIVSATDDLALRTGTLTLADLDDRDFYEREGGGINAGMPVTGDAPGSVNSLSFDIEATREEGVARATIGGGTVEITDMSQEEALELLDTANRDPEAFQETFLSEHVRASGDVDVQGLFELPEMARNVTNLIEAFAAPLPEPVAGAGRESIDYFRRLIVTGLTPEQAETELSTPAVQELIDAQRSWNAATERYGVGALVPDEVRALILSGQDVRFDENGEPTVFLTGCNISSPTHLCQITVDNLGGERGITDIAVAGAQARDNLVRLVSELETLDPDSPEYRTLRAQVDGYLYLYIHCADDYADVAFVTDALGGFDSAQITNQISIRQSAEYIAATPSLDSTLAEIREVDRRQGDHVYLAAINAVNFNRNNSQNTNMRMIGVRLGEALAQVHNVVRGTGTPEEVREFEDHTIVLLAGLRGDMSDEQRSLFERGMGTGTLGADFFGTLRAVEELSPVAILNLGPRAIRNLIGRVRGGTPSTTTRDSFLDSETPAGDRVYHGTQSTAIGDDRATINNFNNAINTGNGHNVIVHGRLDYDDLGGIPTVNGRETNPAQIADAVRSNPNYVEGSPVCFASCWSGQSGSAQQLANDLGAPVYAPTRPVAWDSRSDRWVFDTDVYQPNTLPHPDIEPTWRMFQPAAD